MAQQQEHEFGVKKIRVPFDDVWWFESKVRTLYPAGTEFRYGSPFKSRSGKDMFDFIAMRGDIEIGRHAGMVLRSRSTGKSYAVISRDLKTPPASPELKKLMNEIAAKYGH